MIPTIGNHDVDSRKAGKHPNGFHVAQQLHPGFPFTIQAFCDQFFASGFCIVPTLPQLQFVVLNSVVDHHNEESAKRGTFGLERIEQLRLALEPIPAATHRIAVMHHHPILHSSRFLSEADVIETGDMLLDTLAAGGAKLVIHGHKHHPRLRYADTAHGRVAVFAAGSFAAYLKELFAETRNTFHIVDVLSSDATGPQGIIWTWEWRTEWQRAQASSCGFPFRSGFRPSGDVDEFRQPLFAVSAEAPADKWVFHEPELLERVPQLPYATPSEFLRLQQLVETQHNLELRQDISGAVVLGRRV